MLKRKIFGIIKLLSLCVICCSLFVGGGYFYLRQNFKEAENKVSSIPYSFSAPENKGIMLDICDNLTFLYLDFGEERLKVIIPPEADYNGEIFGYPIDFTVKTDSEIGNRFSFRLEIMLFLSPFLCFFIKVFQGNAFFCHQNKNMIGKIIEFTD